MQVTNKRLRNQQGFTFIEIIASMVIFGMLSAIAIPRVQASIERARVARAIGDIRAIQADVMGAMSGDTLPTNLGAIGRSGMLDPWGNAYVYYPYPPGGGGERTDYFNQPLNDYFDVYSLGEDGATSAPIGSSASKDDIVRASNGGYIGLGAKY